MKTKEFIEKVEAIGYKVGDGEKVKIIRDSDGCIILSVYEDRQYNIDSDYGVSLTPELFSLAVEYAKTPISKRSAKYHVGIIGLSLSTGEKLYLSFNPINGNYFISNLNGHFKNKFTSKAIEQLKQREDIPLDWNKVKLEETNED